MLFDLRGRGRRRTIQVIYVTLAILMGGGLVFFGIGGNTSGGLFDAIGLTGNGGGGGSASDAFDKLEKSAEKRVRANPRDARAWAELARIRFQKAGTGDNYDSQRGTFKDDGRKQLRSSAQAWDRYLALNPARPDDNVATLMVRVFSPAGLNQPAKATTAAEIVSRANPSANTYFQLAAFAYAAGQTRKGDLAAAESLRRAPPAQRSAYKTQIEQAKKGASSGGAGSPSPAG